MRRGWSRRWAAAAVVAACGATLGSAQQSPAAFPPPPEPPPGADLPLLAAWIGRWLPVVAAASYSATEETGEFFARGSDSVTAAGLRGCTLVLHQRSVTTVNAETAESRRVIRVPLQALDTVAAQPKVRRPRMLLGVGESVMLTGQLVVPLRSRTRDSVIAVSSEDETARDSLVAEHLVPFPFAILPATRAARAIRRAAALCAARDSLLLHELDPPVLRPTLLGLVRTNRRQGTGPRRL